MKITACIILSLMLIGAFVDRELRVWRDKFNQESIRLEPPVEGSTALLYVETHGTVRWYQRRGWLLLPDGRYYGYQGGESFRYAKDKVVIP